MRYNLADVERQIVAALPGGFAFANTDHEQQRRLIAVFRNCEDRDRYLRWRSGDSETHPDNPRFVYIPYELICDGGLTTEMIAQEMELALQ